MSNNFVKPFPNSKGFTYEKLAFICAHVKLLTVVELWGSTSCFIYIVVTEIKKNNHIQFL